MSEKNIINELSNKVAALEASNHASLAELLRRLDRIDDNTENIHKILMKITENVASSNISIETNEEEIKRVDGKINKIIATVITFTITITGAIIGVAGKIFFK